MVGEGQRELHNCQLRPLSSEGSLNSFKAENVAEHVFTSLVVVKRQMQFLGVDDGMCISVRWEEMLRARLSRCW